METEKLNKILIQYIFPIWRKVRQNKISRVFKFLEKDFPILQTVDLNTIISSHFKEMNYTDYSEYRNKTDNSTMMDDCKDIASHIPFKTFSNRIEFTNRFERASNHLYTVWLDEFIHSTHLQMHKDFLSNVQRQSSYSSLHERYHTQIQGDKLSTIIRAHSFYWAATPQGFEIWEIINICFVLGVPVRITNKIYLKLLTLLEQE